MANLHRVSHKKRNGKNMSTVMDVEENFVPVNSREDIEKVMSSSGEKKKTKYFKKLFQFLGGGDSPIEAVELALGRDTSLRETQFSVLSIFSLWVDEFNCQTMVGHNERKNLLNFLSNCNIVKLIVRLITLNAVQPDGKVLFSKYIYYHCVNILAHLTNTRYIDNALERLKNMKVIRAYHAIPRLVEFLNPLHSDPLTIYQSSEVLKHLAKEKSDMCFRIHKADGLRRCLHFMLRKEADKMFADYFKENFSSKFSMPSEEVEILEKFYTGKKSILEKTEQYPRVTGFLDHRKECLTYMSAELQENCALVVFEIVSHPKISKAEILTLKPFIKVLNKWFSTPCIWRTERTMLQGCFHLLRGVISEQTPALTVNEFLQNYNILDLLKQHIYNPDPEVLSSVLSLLSELSMRYPELRKKFMASPIYSKLLPVYLLSFDSQIQIWALQCLVSFVQCKSGAKYVMSIGVTAEKLYILREYNSLTTNELIRTLKTEMEKYCKEEWRLSDKMFQDVIVPKYSLERAQKYKEEGNSRFKNEKYDSAIKCYTLGMESVPPVEDFSAAKPYCCDSGFRPWYVLPSVLFTNRAQCYLLMNKWQEAIDDCTQAIVRSYELEKDEAKKILFKTVFRRARAFSELKDYRNALNDISFCLRFNPVATNVRVFFREILTAYRKEFGIESLRRCGTCMEGVGMKLKRCAKCPEMYCSRECQMYAWEEENHKQLCNYTLDENNSE